MATSTRELSGDKAQRIVDAMRWSVSCRGSAGATFDHVAREAGVSRGLLHYYFGTKERLLVEVCRRDCDIRMQVLDEALAGTHTAAELIDALVRSLDDLLRDDPGFIALFFELFTTSRHNAEIAAEVREITRRTREHVAELLEAKEADGTIRLSAGAEAVATVLFALADGLAMRMLADPEHDHRPTIDAAVRAVRELIRPAGG
jgi:AcrR family transcriptional regulator